MDHWSCAAAERNQRGRWVGLKDGNEYYPPAVQIVADGLLSCADGLGYDLANRPPLSRVAEALDGPVGRILGRDVAQLCPQGRFLALERFSAQLGNSPPERRPPPYWAARRHYW